MNTIDKTWLITFFSTCDVMSCVLYKAVIVTSRTYPEACCALFLRDSYICDSRNLRGDARRLSSFLV
jgi:hypothetical protein